MCDKISQGGPACGYPDLSLSSFAQDTGSLPPTSVLPGSQSSSGYSGGSENEDQEGAVRLDQEPFRTPLGFHIPEDVMQRAQSAPKGTDPSFWQHGLYRTADDSKRRVKVHYCKTLETMESVCQYFTNEDIIGLDLEWKANSSATDGIKRNVALIQIASEERVGLFHIARFAGESIEELVAPTFREIMESPAIIKAGVAIKGDCTRLKNYLGIQCHGLFELSHLHRVLKYRRGESCILNKVLVSLAVQVQEHLQLPLLKDAVQTSNWWSKDLDFEQTKYAASDAYACFQLFHHMEAARLSLDPVPPRPAAAELGQPLLVHAIGEDPPDAEGPDLSDDSIESFYTVTSEEDLDSVTNDLTDMSLDDAICARSDGNEALKEEGMTPTSAAARLTTSRSIVPSSQELDTANQWAITYRADNRASCKLQPAQLRAYHLWHHQSMSIHQVSAVLRDPPLKPTTVIDYVCEAIYKGNLPALPRNVADIGQLGIEPVRTNHRQILRTASRIVETGSLDLHEGASANSQVGWWKISK